MTRDQHEILRKLRIAMRSPASLKRMMFSFLHWTPVEYWGRNGRPCRMVARPYLAPLMPPWGMRCDTLANRHRRIALFSQAKVRLGMISHCKSGDSPVLSGPIVGIVSR